MILFFFLVHFINPRMASLFNPIISKMFSAIQLDDLGIEIVFTKKFINRF